MKRGAAGGQRDARCCRAFLSHGGGTALAHMRAEEEEMYAFGQVPSRRLGPIGVSPIPAKTHNGGSIGRFPIT